MQATSSASLFQTSASQALGAYRSRKSTLTSHFQPRYGYPIQLNPAFRNISNDQDLQKLLEEEGAGADGGRFRVLASKVTQEPGDATGPVSYAWTSEAGGMVRQTCLETGETINTYKGAKGPVPSFDFIPLSTPPTPCADDATNTNRINKILVAGSWDKSLRFYNTSSLKNDKSVSTPFLTIPNAMQDFIKAVLIFSTHEGRQDHAGANGNTVSQPKWLCAVAGSDKSIMIYDVSILRAAHTATTAKTWTVDDIPCLNQSKIHTRPINCLASLPSIARIAGTGSSLPEGSDTSCLRLESKADGRTRVYSADSMGRIIEYVWNNDIQRLEPEREVQGFATSVYDLKVFWNLVAVDADEDDDGEGREIQSRLRMNSTRIAKSDVGADQTQSGSDAATEGLGDNFLSPVQTFPPNDGHDEGIKFRYVAELWAASGDKSVAGYRLSPLLVPPTPPASSSAGAGNNSAGNGLKLGGASNGATGSRLAAVGHTSALTSPFVKIPHKDFVKSVLPVSAFRHLLLLQQSPSSDPSALTLLPGQQQSGHSGLAWPRTDLFGHTTTSTAVITGGSDEHVRMFLHPSRQCSNQQPLHRSGGRGADDDDDDDADGDAAKVYEIEAHWNEITSIQGWIRTANSINTRRGQNEDTIDAAGASAFETSSSSTQPAESTSPRNQQTLPPFTNDVGEKKHQLWIITTGLDGSIRRWQLSSLTSFPPPSLNPELEPNSKTSNKASVSHKDENEWNEHSIPQFSNTNKNHEIPSSQTKPNATVQLTAEEEAELAELMDSEDDEV